MRLGLACAVITLAAACGPGTGSGDDASNITALTVAPAMATLESIDHAEAFQDFTVRATYMDGSFKDVTADVVWNVQPQFGTMDGARFVTTGQVGGIATVTAAIDTAVGTAEVTINIRQTRVDPSAPPNAPDLFGSGTLDPTRAPSVIYPPDQVVVPSNLGDFDVHWADASNNDVWEIGLKSAHSDVRVYVGASFPRWYTFSATEWEAAAANEDDVTATVRGVSTAVPGMIGASAGVTAILPDQPIQGGLYYWSSGAALPAFGNWNFGTYTPTGDHLITAMDGNLDIRDGTTGAAQGQIPTGMWTSQPDFSPTGNVIAYVGAPMAAGSYNVSFTGGSIVVQPYDGANYGVPTTIVQNTGGAENNYYPSVSPDGQWVVYNKSTGDSYNDPDAELWVAPVGGGSAIRLNTANLAPGLTNSWPRWAPFEQTVNGERMFFLTFSSVRQFGNRLAQGVRPQIWMTGFFPARAAMGADPTGPAFWLPFQNLNTNNHIAQWTEQVIPIQ